MNKVNVKFFTKFYKIETAFISKGFLISILYVSIPNSLSLSPKVHPHCKQNKPLFCYCEVFNQSLHISFRSGLPAWFSKLYTFIILSSPSPYYHIVSYFPCQTSLPSLYFITLAGFPPTMAYSGTSFVTTAPAPTMAPL